MSGLTARNQAGQSGLVAPKVDFQRFATTSATWTKPADVKIVWIECYGAGGGGGGVTAAVPSSCGGGGGGAMAWACFSADALPSTLDVIAGAGGAGGDNDDGTAGGHSQVDIPSDYSVVAERNKVILIAYGGGGGANQQSGTDRKSVV